MRMKLALAAAEQAEHAVAATEEDWLRNGFGPHARFTAFLAEHAGEPVGMITCSEHYYTGWPKPAIYIGDVFVEPRFRRCGVARALLAQVAALALARGSPMIELTVQPENSARLLYRRCGFHEVESCVTYVADLATLRALAQDQPLAHCI